jgi:hypothetical protein
MPAKAKVTKDDVFSAADRLAARGARITLRAIRKELGDQGSMGTIQAAYTAWMASHNSRRAPTTPRPTSAVAYWSAEVQRLTNQLRKATSELVKAAASGAGQ